jgi:hypothetical protein
MGGVDMIELQGEDGGGRIHRYVVSFSEGFQVRTPSSENTFW